MARGRGPVERIELVSSETVDGKERAWKGGRLTFVLSLFSSSKVLTVVLGKVTDRSLLNMNIQGWDTDSHVFLTF